MMNLSNGQARGSPMLLKVAIYQTTCKNGLNVLIENGPWKCFQKKYKISKVSVRLVIDVRCGPTSLVILSITR